MKIGERSAPVSRSPLLPLAPAERVLVALCANILLKCIRIVIVAFGSAPIPAYLCASRLGNVGLPPKPAWGFHPQTPSSLRASFKIPYLTKHPFCLFPFFLPAAIDRFQRLRLVHADCLPVQHTLRNRPRHFLAILRLHQPGLLLPIG